MGMIEYQKEYKIPVYDIGADGKLNTHSLFNYLQDLASEHAVKLGFGKDDLITQNHFWVLSRLAATIEIWPGWEETIVVKTWPRGTDRLFALRDYEVSYPDGRIIATASSSWLVVDITSRRVQRPDYILTSFNSGTLVRSAMGRNAEKLEAASENGAISASFRVRQSDLDVNLHTNHAMYIKWVADCYDLEFRMNNLPFSFEVNYIAESRWDEEISLRTSEDKNNVGYYNHSVIRSVDNSELCRVRIGWKDCRP
jgi:medium-chain acyl-[acyl-carrier-protein] hydrolase